MNTSGSSTPDAESCTMIMAHLPMSIDPFTVADCLVKKRLAASISLLPGIFTVRASKKKQSKYLSEVILLIQTKSKHIEQITDYIICKHPSRAPKVNVTYVPIKICFKEYSQWVLENSSGIPFDIVTDAQMDE